MASRMESKKTVLAVDDSPENLDVLKGQLTPDYIVKAAINGAVALKIASKRPPDIVLLDVRMPGMDGFEVCQALKQDSTTRDVPVIFVTGEDDAEIRAAATKAGVADILSKPVDSNALRETIERCLIGGC